MIHEIATQYSIRLCTKHEHRKHVNSKQREIDRQIMEEKEDQNEYYVPQVNIGSSILCGVVTKALMVGSTR